MFKKSPVEEAPTPRQLENNVDQPRISDTGAELEITSQYENVKAFDVRVKRSSLHYSTVGAPSVSDITPISKDVKAFDVRNDEFTDTMFVDPRCAVTDVTPRG